MLDLKTKKIIIVTISIIIILIVTIVSLYDFWIKEIGKNEIIWIHVRDLPYTTSWTLINDKEKGRLINESMTKKDNKINTAKINKIKAYLRTFCKNYNDINLFVWSNHFKILKERVDDFENKTWKFIYIELPSYVYEACSKKDSEYTETLILYLQTNEKDLPEIKNKINSTVLENYIKNLSLIESWVKPKNLKDKDNFNNFFLNEQIEELESFYYPYYVKEKWNVSSFLAKPIFSLEWDNKNKELALTKLLSELKQLWFDSLDEFKKALLKNNNYNSIDELKTSIMKDYNNIMSKSPELKNKLSNLWEFKSYINTWKYKEVTENDKLSDDFKKLWKNMLIFSIVSTDYADWLNENWSWKEFFWDDLTWNWIIRLNFIYILTL